MFVQPVNMPAATAPPLCIYQEHGWGQGKIIFAAAYGPVAPAPKSTNRQNSISFDFYVGNWSFAVISVGGCMQTAL